MSSQFNYKILISRSFSIICYFFAGYCSLVQVLDYITNADVSLVTYKKYNEEPADRYPTFSICLRPSFDEMLEYGNNLYQEEKLNQSLGMSGADYFSMLIGASFEGDGLTNFSLLEFDDAKWDLTIMIRSYGVYSNQDEPLMYWDSEDTNASIPNSLFYPGYQSPGRVCFTRNNSYYPFKGILIERMYLDVENWIGDLYVYLHYPGQLMNVVEQGGKYKINLLNSD